MNFSYIVIGDLHSALEFLDIAHDRVEEAACEAHVESIFARHEIDNFLQDMSWKVENGDVLLRFHDVVLLLIALL